MLSEEMVEFEFYPFELYCSKNKSYDKHLYIL